MGSPKIARVTMLVDAFLNFAGVIVDGALALLPNWTMIFPTGAIQAIVGETTRWNSILPVVELYWLVAASLILLFALLMYYIVMWVVKRLTFSG